MSVSRRQFVQGVAAIATSAAVARGGRSDEADRAPIIDCHQHLWDLEKLKLPWITPGGLLGRSYVMADYLQAIEGTGIERAVYMEVDVAADQKQLEADLLTEICRSGKAPTVAAVVGGNPLDAGFRKYAAQFQGSRYVRGIRQVLHGGLKPGTCVEKQFVASIRHLGELGLSFDLCMRPQELADCAKLATLCPETQFILDHCGNPDLKGFLSTETPDAAAVASAAAWKRYIEELAQRKNVVCKISGIVAGAAETWKPDDLAPIVNHCLDTFGPDRVVFGSDWPVCLKGATLAAWVAALREIIKDRPQEEQRKLLHDNAVKLYRI